MLEFTSESAEETQCLGVRIGALVRAGDVILLSGELGAGKTTLVKGIARGMGIEDPVTSPTFTLIQEYGPPSSRLVHVDPYRLGSEEELIGIGFEECLDSGNVLVVEWSERLGTLAPAERLDVEIGQAKEDTRRIHLIPRGARYSEIVQELRNC